MQQKYLRVLKSKLNYYVTGNGEEVMLFFHGYGQDASMYFELPDALMNNYKCVLIDLFGHGESSFFSKEKVDLVSWKGVLEALLEQENATRVHVLGFSLGGRAAINAAFVLNDRIESLTLLAPDGVVNSFVYKAATSNLVLKAFFKRMVFYPGAYQVAIKLGKKLKLVDKASIEFVDRVMSKRSRRFRLYKIWNMYAGLSASLSDLKAISKYPIQVYLAKKDHFINTPKVIKVCEDLNVAYTVYKVGHFHVVDAYFRSLAKRSS